MARPVQLRREPAIGRLRPSISPTQSDPPGYIEMNNAWAVPRSDGAIETVPGFSALSVAAENLKGLVYAKSSAGVKLLLAVGAAQLWDVSLADDSTYGDFTSLLGSLTYTNEFGYFVYSDAIYLFNGTLPKKITVVSSPVVSNPGLTRPDVETWVSEGGLTVVKSGRGEIHGIVKYYISEVTESGGVNTEGALSEAFGETDTLNRPDQIDLTFDPTALTTPADMENRNFRIYRTFADGVDPFLIDEQTVEVATGSITVTDNTPDEELGDPSFAHGDPPPVGMVAVAFHLERAWGADGSDLYYSDTAQPESWFVSAAGQVISVFKDDGDEITALGSTREGLIIWKRDHMYILTGRLEEEYFLDRITQAHQQSRNIGTPGVSTVAAMPGGFIFYWNRAVYTFVGARIDRISQEIESDFNANLDKHEDEIFVGYDSFNGRVWVSVPISGSTASHTYFYSLRLGYWVGRMERGFKGYQYVDDNNEQKRLFAVGVE